MEPDSAARRGQARPASRPRTAADARLPGGGLARGGSPAGHAARAARSAAVPGRSRRSVRAAHRRWAYGASAPHSRLASPPRAAHRLAPRLRRSPRRPRPGRARRPRAGRGPRAGSRPRRRPRSRSSRARSCARAGRPRRSARRSSTVASAAPRSSARRSSARSQSPCPRRRGPSARTGPCGSRPACGRCGRSSRCRQSAPDRRRSASSPKGRLQRFTRNPGPSLARITVLPIASPVACASARASSEERSPATTSSRRITGAGLKKCIPTTRCGLARRRGDRRDQQRGCVRRDHALPPDDRRKSFDTARA